VGMNRRGEEEEEEEETRIIPICGAQHLAQLITGGGNGVVDRKEYVKHYNVSQHDSERREEGVGERS
jgi:hypothetical protein